MKMNLKCFLNKNTIKGVETEKYPLLNPREEGKNDLIHLCAESASIK